MFSAGFLKRAALLLLLAAGSASSVACSSLYWSNRGRDAADVFTLEFSTQSYGLSVRAGPLQLGAAYKDAAGYSGGLRGGSWGQKFTAGFTALFFGADYLSSAPIRFSPPGEAEAEEASDSAEESSDTAEAAPPSTQDAAASEDTGGPAIADENEAGDVTPLLSLRHKEYRARAPLGTQMPAHLRRSLLKQEGEVFAPGSYFTQLDLSLGVYFGLRIGFNPGELLDLLLGFLNFDPMDDDAPYEATLEEQLLESPYFRNLDRATRQQILERVRSGDLQLPGAAP
ncbi:MAG: hypothetical protein K1X75_02770 [Leptospirales bacterium]|nr:hypothetical protein [Leptospirales bacterium]